MLYCPAVHLKLRLPEEYELLWNLIISFPTLRDIPGTFPEHPTEFRGWSTMRTSEFVIGHTVCLRLKAQTRSLGRDWFAGHPPEVLH
jgi:hypothetical protein